MRTLTVIVLLLAIFGASVQCVADCLPQPNTPPCHQHSQKKEPCKHGQLVAVTQVMSDHPVAASTLVTLPSDQAETASHLPVRLLTILRI